jgi:DNA-directed RNA polymerase subunit M/transcription elongation factor TFIIS
MKFCETCRNMMLLTTDATGVGAAYRCPSCTRVDAIAPDAPHVVRESRSRQTDALHKRYVTANLTADPTLPRPPGAQCPFCETVGEVAYVKYAPVSYLYACGSCDAFWKHSASGEAVAVTGRT